jgi:Flp pilus assembly protein TadB
MNTRRRLGGKNKTKETKAAATGAIIALMPVLFKLCLFIFKVYYLF